MEFNEYVDSIDATKLNSRIHENKDIKKSTTSCVVNDIKMFIMTINVNSKPLLKFDYYIVGSFDKKKNVWIWANNSSTLDKSLISQVVQLQYSLKHDNLHQAYATMFKKSYAIILTDDFKRWLGSVADHLNKINQHLITLNRSDRYVDVLVVKQIIYSAYEL